MFKARLIILFVLAYTLMGCSSAVKFSSENAPDPRGGSYGSARTVKNNNPAPAPAPESSFRNIPPAAVYSGKASYYADKFHGRATANGEIYNMNGMTAAHLTLPFDTIVRVTNKENGKSVKVRINDRGPHIPGRIIDLSLGAARKIGLDISGVAEVKIEVLQFGG